MTRSLVILSLSLLPFLIISALQSPFQRFLSDRKELEQQWQKAIEQTEEHFTSMGKSWKSFAQSDPELYTGLSASTSSQLNGQLRPGFIEKLSIFDQNCQLRARSEPGLSLQWECPSQELALQENHHFFWNKQAEDWHLAFMQLLSSKPEDRLFLHGTVSLNETWLAQFPLLKRRFQSWNLTLKPKHPSDTPFLSLGQDLPFAIYSQDRLLNMLPLGRFWQDEGLLRLQLLSLLLFFMSVATLAQQFKRREALFQNKMLALHQWTLSLAPEGEKTPDDSKITSLDQVKETIAKLFKKQRDENESLTHKLGQALQNEQELEEKLILQQSEQLLLSKTRALTEQMNQSAQAHLTKLSEVQSLSEDISHLLAAEIARPAHKLADLVMIWEAELVHVNPRKLARSLAERVDEQGVSELEKGLLAIFQYSSELRTHAEQLVFLAQTLVRDCEEHYQLARHWHALLGTHIHHSQELKPLIEASARLLALQDASFAIEHQVLLPPDFDLSPYQISESLLHSSLLHLQWALLICAKHDRLLSPRISYRIKERDEKYWLVISLVSAGESLMHPWPEASERQLLLAQQLMSASPLQLHRLPDFGGVRAIALTWPSKAIQPEARPSLESPRASLEG